jgi:hypothetical protein
MEHAVQRPQAIASALCALAVLAAVAAPGPARSAWADARAGSAASPWPGSNWYPSDPKYGVGITTNVPIRMDDGVTLIGDVQYPTDPATGARASGRFPVLLTQNPYGCDVPNGTPTPVSTLQNVAPAGFFVPHGYIFATVCVRGTGRSGGELSFFGKREALDGPQIADWAAKLDGSNGEVGLTGCSYLGITQFAAAGGTAHSPVKAIAPFCAGTEVYRGGFMGDGVPDQAAAAYSALSPLLITPRAAPVLAGMAANIFAGKDLAYDGAFWKERRREQYLPQIVKNNIPALLWSGYDDIFLGGALETYAYLQNAYFGRPLFAPMRPGRPVTGRYQVVIGPWEHGGGIDNNILLEWFDTWLKGVHTGMDRTNTPMHVFDRTAQQWVNLSSYPATDRYTPMYLGTDRTLSVGPVSNDGSDTIDWGRPENGATLTYTSAPTGKGFVLAGPVAATLYARSPGSNLELIATLQDVDPAGTVTKLSDGYVIGSLRARDATRSWRDRNGRSVRPWCVCDADHWLTPGQVERLDVRLKPVVATIAPGHALRLVLTTQAAAIDCTITHHPVDRPAGMVVSGDPCYPTAPQLQTLPGTYTIEHGPSAPASISLPMLPYGSFPYTGSGKIPTDWGRS